MVTVLAVAGAALVAAAPGAGAPTVKATSLGVSTYAYDVSDGGQVVGYVDLVLGASAFSWTKNGGLVQLPTLGGSWSQAAAVNEGGTVVGTSAIALDLASHAFIWTDGGGMVDLGTLGGQNSYPVGVAETGLVAGNSEVPGGLTHGFAWTAGGGMVDIGTLPGDAESRVYGVSDTGLVVGASIAPSGGPVRAIWWTEADGINEIAGYVNAWSPNGAGQVLVNTSGAGVHAIWTQAGGAIPITPSPGFEYVSMYALSEDGQAVGLEVDQDTVPPTQLPISWTEAGGTLQLTGTGLTWGVAYDANANGLVVGSALFDGDPGQDAFAWTPADGAFDIDASDSVESAAEHVSETGLILGYRVGSGVRESVLWELVPTFTVNSTADTSDGSCDAAPDCTLREAILAANAQPNGDWPDEIHFDIPGAGVQTIAIATPLPNVTDAVVIDGATQPGFLGAPLIELSGGPASAIGLDVYASGTTIRSLVLNGFPNRAIRFTGGTSGGAVTGSYLGTNATGTAAVGSFAFGALELQGSASNTVGGPGAGDRNVVAGYVSVTGVGATGNVIEGNYLGLEATGTTAFGGASGVLVSTASGTILRGNAIAGLPSIQLSDASGTTITGNTIGTNAAGTTDAGAGSGITMFSSPGTTIGGTTPAERNVIAGTSSAGIRIQGPGTAGTVVAGNQIGLNGVPNAGNGVELIGGATGVTIGGAGIFHGNRIEYNGGDGVALLDAGSGTATVRNNAIDNNGGLGIDLGGDGVTPNDALDADSGANTLLNTPTVTSAVSGATETTVTVSFSGEPNLAGLVVDLYESVSCDASGSGEGEAHLMSITGLSTDGTGASAGGGGSTSPARQVGRFVTATVTDAAGNTSEFSPCVAITAAPSTTFTVNSAADTDDGSCDAAPDCTLREAILAANAAGEGTIEFDIAGAAPHVISPATALPAVTAPVTIDGTTQAGAPPGALGISIDGAAQTVGDDGLVLLSGSDGSVLRGLNVRRFRGASIRLDSNGNAVRGSYVNTTADGLLAMVHSDGGHGVVVLGSNNVVGGPNPGDRNLLHGGGASHAAVWIDGTLNGAANRVEGNYIGVDRTGTTGLGGAGNGLQGVLVSGSSLNTVGGGTAAHGNVIADVLAGVVLDTGSGTGNTVRFNVVGLAADGVSAVNGTGGVGVDGPGILAMDLGSGTIADNVVGRADDGITLDGATSNNVLERNHVGTDAAGTLDHGNVFAGIRINGGTGNTIGGATLADGNVVAFNDGGGIVMLNTSSGFVIRNNLVGTDAAFSVDRGNGNVDNPFGILATGTGTVGPGNVIGRNEGGVVVDNEASRVRITQNAIDLNDALGIDLDADGTASPNDPLDADTGPNGLQNHPALTSATAFDGFTNIAVGIEAAPNTLYLIEFFSSPACDGSGTGEGRTYLGASALVTDGGGSAPAAVASVGTVPPVGHAVTAVAIAPDGSTSELSPCVTVQAAATVEAAEITSLNPGGAVEAGASVVPYDAVPAQAFLLNQQSAARATPINETPVSEVLLRGSPLNELPLNETGLDELGPLLDDVLLSTVPLLREGGWEAALRQTRLAGPIQGVTLGDVYRLPDLEQALAGLDLIELGDLDLTHSPLGQVSAVAYAVGEATLSDLPLASGTWCEVFSGPPISCSATSPLDETTATLLALGVRGAPLNELPIDEVPLNETPVNELPINETPINELHLEGNPINELPVNELPVNETPLNETSVDQVPINETTAEGIPVNELPINELPMSGIPVNELPVNELPLNETPINELQINELPLNETPVNELPVNELLLNGSPLNELPVNELASPQAIFDCSGGCPTSGTLGDHLALLLPDATLADLRRATTGGDLPAAYTLGGIGGWGSVTIGGLIESLQGVEPPVSLATILALVQHYEGADPPPPAFGDLFDLLVAIDELNADVSFDLADLAVLLRDSDVTLADLLAALLSEDLGWEKLDLEAVRVQDYSTSEARARYRVELTVGGLGIGTVSFSATLPPGFTYVPGSTKRIVPVGGGLFSVTNYADPAISGGRLTWQHASTTAGAKLFSFEARPGLRLGPAAATLEASAGGAPPVQGTVPAVLDVTETLEPNPVDAPVPLAADAFHLSYVTSAGDGDYYALEPPAAGSRVTVRLSHLPADFDLVVYGPDGQLLVPASPDAVPLDGQPLADETVAPTHTIEPLQAQTLGDVRVEAGRSVVGISALRGTQDDAVLFTSAGGTEPYVIQVTGYNGATSTQPYMLRADIGGTRAAAGCVPRDFQGRAGTPAAELTFPAVLPDDLDTVLVVNKAQLERVHADAATALTALQSRVADFTASGHPSAIVYVDADPAADGAAVSWNACPGDPSRANALAREVDRVLDGVRAGHAGLRNVVLVGGDDVTPFWRLDDRTTVANELGYSGVFPASSAVGGALALGKLLSDDPYGTIDPVPFFDRQLFVPELAVGRLVETPAQIVSLLEAFFAGDPDGALGVDSALTTAYDFLGDGGAEIADALGTLAPAGASATLFGETWTSANLAAALDRGGGQTPSIVSLNAHADHSRLEPAAGGTLYTVDDVLAAALTFGGRIVFATGCHAGLNVPAAFLPPEARARDWAETLVERGAAAYAGNTGFGYGDSDVVAYSEDLNARLAAKLAEGLPIGQALVEAKQEYSSELGIVGVYDEKAMAELTLYGLPMLAAATAPAATPTGGAGAAVAAAAPELRLGAVAAEAAALEADPVTGLDVEPFAVDDATLPGRRVDRPRGTYFRARDGVFVTHFRPLVPKAVAQLEAEDAHGALVTELTSVDVSPIDPLFARPIVDLAAHEPELPFDDVAFPGKLQTVTTYESGGDRRHRLVLAQGQFFAADPADGDEDGFQRLFTHVAGHAHTSSSSDYRPPAFTRIQAVKIGGTVAFTAELSEGAPAVRRVLVGYLDRADGVWTFVDLAPEAGEPRRWSGGGLATRESIQYFVQAVDAAGNVAVTTNKGFYYAGAAPSPPSGSVAPTLEQVAGAPSGGFYTGPVEVGVTAPDGVTAVVGVDGGPFTEPPALVTGDGVHRVVVEASNGERVETAFVIDTTAPAIRVESPAPGQEVPRSSPLVGAFSCRDATGAVSTCTATVTGPAGTSTVGSGEELPTRVEGEHTVTVAARDAAGNEAVDEVRYVVGEPEPLTGKILFTSAGDVWAVDPDGGGLLRLTATPEPEEQPALAPGGRRFAFARLVGGAWRVLVAEADGQFERTLAAIGQSTAPSWAPDGTRIAFESTRSGSKGSDVYTVPVPASAAVWPATPPAATNVTNASGDDRDPAWSPGGGRIAFSSNRQKAQFDIYTMSTTGASVTRLTTDAKQDVDPAWSPGGGSVAFSSNRVGGGGGFELYTMTAGGGDQTRLTTSPGVDNQPFWIGAGIVFHSGRSGGGDLYLVAPAGSVPTRLTTAAADDLQPG